MILTECQEEILTDVGRNGKERPWATHKVQAGYIAVAYKTIGNEKKFERIMNCATFLGFKQTEGVMKLKEANFCRVRLCPTCAWRRSLKTFGQMYKIISVAHQDYAFIHLVLTVKNVYGDDLCSTLVDLSNAWNKFIGYKDVKNAVKGYYRATEVSHNVDVKSKSYDTYHPHFHCILAVNKSYFSGKTYMKRSKWVELWKKAARLDYDPDVYIKRIKSDNVEGAIAELSKYTTKFEDIILPDKWKVTEETVRVLDKALENKRFISFGGVFKEIHRKLNLDDIEEGDLIHLDEDNNTNDDEKDIIYYTWNSGYSQYVRS